MADEQVIIDIKVSSEEVSEANKKIELLTSSIEELSTQTAAARKQNAEYKKQQQELTEQYNQNKISADKYLSEVDKLNGKIQANNKLIAENSVHLSQQKNERNANIKLVDSETGAYTKLSTNLNKLRNAYKDLVVEKKHDTVEGKAMLLQIQQLDEQLKEVDTTVGQHQRKIGQYENAAKSLRQELRELKQSLYNLEAGTEEYNKALQRAAFLMDEMGDTNARIAGTAMDFEGVMGNVVKVTSGAASAFEATQGAMALFGSESEDMQKAMLKVQAAIALANGLQGLDGFGKALKNLGTQMKTWAAGVKTSLLSTGIGAIVVAFGLLIANWDKIKQAMTGVGGAQIKLNDLAKENLKTQEMQTQALEASDNILRIQGKSERQIIELKKEAVRAEITKAEIALDSQRRINKAQIDAEARNLTIMKALMDPVRFMLEMVENTIEKLGSLVGKKWDLGLTDSFDKLNTWFAKGFFDPEETKKKFAVEEAEADIHVKELWNKYYGLELNLRDLNKKTSQENIKSKQEEREELEKNIESSSDFKRDEEEELAKQMIDEDAALKETLIVHEQFLTEELSAERLKQLENAVEYMDEQEMMDAESKARQLEREKEFQEAKKALKEDFFEETEDYLQDLAQMRVDENLETIKSNAEAEQEILKNQLDKGIISEDEYNQKILELNKKTKLEEAKQNKKSALWDIAISTAVGIAKAIPDLVEMAAAAAAGALQAAFVAARPLPAFGGGVNDIVSIGDSHASGRDVSVWGFSGGQKQFFGKVERGEAMPVIRKSAINDYQIAKLNGKFSSNNRNFANGTTDIMQNSQQIDSKELLNNMMIAFSNVNIVAKIEDITKEAGRKMEIIDNSKI